MEGLTLESLRGIAKNGPTDPIEYYRWPVVGTLFRSRINRGLRLIPDRPYTRGLEIGYGAGGLLVLLSKHVAELHGIDLDADPESVRAVLKSRNCTATLVQGSVYELPYAADSMDLIVCFSVFEHLHDYTKALSEVRRVLKPGGVFLLGMPAVNKLMELLFHSIGHSTINDIHVSTPRMISDGFKPAGLKVVDAGFLDIPGPRPFGVRLYNNWLLQK